MTQDLYSTKQPSSDKVEKVKDVTAHVKVEETKSEVQKSSQKVCKNLIDSCTLTV